MIPKNKTSKTNCNNIFADLNLPNPEELLVKAELARQICHIIKKKRLTEKQAAQFLGISHPKISALLDGKFPDFSLEKLFKFLNKLGQDVSIKIKPMAKTCKQGDVYVNLTQGQAKSLRTL